MKMLPVKVECHAGYKADETPRFFSLYKIRIEVREVAERWYQEYCNEGFPETDYFRVLTQDHKNFLLKHELRKDRWFVLYRGECLNL